MSELRTPQGSRTVRLPNQPISSSDDKHRVRRKVKVQRFNCELNIESHVLKKRNMTARFRPTAGNFSLSASVSRSASPYTAASAPLLIISLSLEHLHVCAGMCLLQEPYLQSSLCLPLVPVF